MRVHRHGNPQLIYSNRNPRPKQGAVAGADYWQRQGDPGLTLEGLLERSEVVAIVIDGGGLDDLLGLAVVGRGKDTRDWLHWGRAWAHPSVMEQRKSEAGRLRDFEKDGDLVIVDETGDDIEQIADPFD